jgi:small GTP-binding protein
MSKSIDIDNLLSPRSCYRINIIGPYKSGKTTIFKNNEANTQPTHSASVSPTMECRYFKHENESFCFIVTDTPGHSSFELMNEFYYRNYDALVIVVDLSSERNFFNLPAFIDRIKIVNPEYNNPDKTIILVGNDRARQIISDDRIETYAKQHAFFYFKFNIHDVLFLNKIFEQVIVNKKNGKHSFRLPCFYGMMNCFQNRPAVQFH